VAAYNLFTDNALTNDLHGLLDARPYIAKAYVKIPTSGSIQASEISLTIRDFYAGTWHDQAANPVSTGGWQEVATTKLVNTTAGAATFGFLLAAAASSSDFFYVGLARLIPASTFNDYSQNFYDLGNTIFRSS
jgi:hypothetical protein